MTRTDGEHELVLGNKQLLSTFFIVVILLGVFFTMGYFVGRNTASSGFNSGQGSSSGGNRPDAAGKPVESGSTSSGNSAAPPDSTSPANDPNAAVTTPASSVTPAAAPPPAETRSETRPEPAPAAAERPAEKAKPAGASAPAVVNTRGSELYLQVFALRRPDADNEVKILRERGYPALLGESSREGVYRVLVGPYKSVGEMGNAKANLKAKGIDSIVAK